MWPYFIEFLNYDHISINLVARRRTEFPYTCMTILNTLTFSPKFLTRFDMYFAEMICRTGEPLPKLFEYWNIKNLVAGANFPYNYMFSRLSIIRICRDYFFTSSNYLNCKLICISGNLNLLKSLQCQIMVGESNQNVFFIQIEANFTNHIWSFVLCFSSQFCSA